MIYVWNRFVEDEYFTIEPLLKGGRCLLCQEIKNVFLH
jgi:hypothetical protein